VHYVDEGEGQPILMCHGNPTWSFLYRHVIKSLRERFRCIAIDYPGFGLSARPRDYGYTPAEHATVVGSLVRELGLSDLVVMGHDWGGPIGASVACSDPARVSGLVLGNTWLWPVDRRARMFSRVMSTRPVQRAILNRNLFVEQILPRGVVRRLAPEEMEHYRRAQPTPDARRGVAEFPRQLVAATPMLAELERRVTHALADKRVLITFPLRDVAVRARQAIPRMQQAFPDVEVVKLPQAKHYFLEDAPDEVSEAITARFG
jgi:haloalkane dehalogenase